MSLDIYLYLSIDTGGNEPKTVILFENNCTHNYRTMAKEAGIYEYVWRPDECDDVKTAGDLIKPLRAGIKLMEDEPQRFIVLNPANGCGNYETFLPWLRKYLAACVKHPKAFVDTCR